MLHRAKDFSAFQLLVDWLGISRQVVSNCLRITCLVDIDRYIINIYRIHICSYLNYYPFFLSSVLLNSFYLNPPILLFFLNFLPHPTENRGSKRMTMWCLATFWVKLQEIFNLDLFLFFISNPSF